MIKLEDRFGPEHVRVFVEEGRVRVAGQREISVGGDDDVMECLHISREIKPPAGVNLDGLSVMFRDGGRLVLEAPRVQSAEEESKAKHKTDQTKQDNHESESEQLNIVENMKNSADKHNEERAKSDSEMEVTLVTANKETSPENKSEEDEEYDVEMKESEPKQTEENVKTNISKDKEIDKSNTSTECRIQERPEHPVPAVRDENKTGTLAMNVEEPGTLPMTIYTEDQQQAQMEESDNQLLVMNVAGFDPNEVKVKVEGRRATVKASQQTEEEGFYSRRKYFRSFLLPPGVTPGHVTCSLAPSSGRLVITNMTQQ